METRTGRRRAAQAQALEATLSQWERVDEIASMASELQGFTTGQIGIDDVYAILNEMKGALADVVEAAPDMPTDPYNGIYTGPTF